ncbi:uncharacterized protein LOC120115968 [Hibiscus syriacus]|uniref:uncharacterized protein LOC120115968 n=1 Tax=Hibiscus syriacus TaxID=106335 RepID=UPI0019205052|nr:uncharacterized protein LOC120115968 [Hibiscus syriacus]
MEALCYPSHNTIRSHAEANENQTSDPEVRNSLKQERLLRLHDRLQDQSAARHAFDKAAKKFLKDIAVLELEIAYLENHLLLLYRKTFNRRFLCLKTIEENPKPTSVAQKETFTEVPEDDIMSDKENPPKECIDVWGTKRLLDSSIVRSHSSLSRGSAYSVTSPQKNVDKANAQTNTSNGLSLVDHFVSDRIPETPNQLSKEMIRTISTIYCELADPPLNNHDNFSSPMSYSSSVEDMWRTPLCQKFSSFNLQFDNPFNIAKSKGSS